MLNRSAAPVFTRRTLLEGATVTTAGWLLSACTPAETPSTATVQTTPTPAQTVSIELSPSASPGARALVSPAPSANASARAVGYVFNSASQDVTIFDVATHQPVGTRPFGTAITWLSSEQRFWDGQYIWTFDYPQNQVRVIAIDPQNVAIARTIPTGGKGPAHSLMLTPDLRSAWVNIAGDDFLALLDVRSGQLVAQVKTGKFP